MIDKHQHMFRLIACALIGAMGLLIGAGSTTAQAPGHELSGQARAAFHISPLIHHLEARPGQIIPFEFQIRTREGNSEVKVELVGLEQDAHGRIRHTRQAVPDGLELETPEQMLLTEDQADVIAGQARIPTDTSYFAFGILVTDAGRPAEVSGNEATDDEQTRATVRFVTRYLLRVEVRVPGGGGASVAELDVHEGEMATREGRAVARVELRNPTSNTLELQAQARLVRTDTEEPTPLGPYFSLHHSVRANAPEERRRQVRVLGGSRVVLEAPVPEPVFEGEYDLQVRLVTPTRRAEYAFPVAVEEGEFPAQQSVVARVVQAVQITPPALELSSGPGGARLETLYLQNTSSRAMELRLTPIPFEEVGAGDGDQVRVRPEVLALAPGRQRGVMVAMSGQGKDAPSRYFLLQVEVEPEDGGAGGVLDIPLAMNVADDAPREAEIEDPQWIAEQNLLAVSVTNAGQTHLVLDGHAQLSDPFDRSLRLRAGYGRWLLPGQQAQLQFQPARALPSGPYELELRVQIAPDEEPKIIRRSIEVP